MCGGGAFLYLSESHFFELSMGLGEGTNNYAKLMSLKLLMIFAVEKGCNNLPVYGDSMNVINWIKGTQQCRILRLENVLRSAREILSSFDFFSCQHIYRENNVEVDVASKVSLFLEMGQ